MAVPTITLTHSLVNSGNPVTIRCTSVTTSNKRNLTVKPNANISAPIEVQGNAVENRRIVLNRVMFSSSVATALTEEDLENLLSLEYDGTNAPILTISYDRGGSRTFKSMTGSTSIPVILESYNYPIDMIDSDQAFLPSGTLSFVETTANV